MVSGERTLEKIQRARLGDMSATRALVEDLQEPILAMTQVCVALGWPVADVVETFASALAVAIETFEQDAPSFVDHALNCLLSAIHAGREQSVGTPN